MKRTKTLTRAEEEIMQLIWKLERCTVKDVIDQLDNPEIPHSTVSSVVRILEKKEFVAHKAYGKTHEYFPVIARKEYAEQGVSSLLERYFGGSPKQLVSFLIQKENLDLKELAELMKTINKKTR